MIITTITVLLWSFLHIKNRNSFDVVIAGVNSDDYPLLELYYIGFGFMKLIKYDMEKKNSRKRIKEIGEVYGKKYAAYYYYVLVGAKFTFILTFVPFTLLLSMLSGKTSTLLLGGVATALLIWYLDEKVNDKVMERHDELLRAYPQMLSKLTLLVNSGMPIRDAWRKVSESNQGLLYREMRVASEELANGISEIEVYRAFGERCAIKPLKKFSSMMLQNLQKGSSEVVAFLKEMSNEAWEEKKHMIKRKGEVASSKLMLPIGMIFIGVLLLIIVPMFNAL
jgi:Type II secretory pathway, component PulF